MKSFIYYYCLVIASLLLFLYGFFPMQQNQVLSSVEPPKFLHDLKFNLSHVYREEINRIILIVIDALRLDFITQENMPFLTSIYPKDGCMLTVHVESPTVTLPRIKALTTGSIPQFVDVIFNLASTEMLTDSFLHRASEAGKKIIFYGDDTWLKLYPSMFARHEGVSSFYVSDYTEVDYNVTRNVLTELNNEDWDIMLLHYLGLDHIGHVFGPYSSLIRPKLQEMDAIIETIYKSTRRWNKKTLIAVTGDHGMKDSGGHGGSTTSETTVPFVAIGSACKNDSIAQIDVPPTLAALMGLPLPACSIGRVATNMFISYPFDRLLYILHYATLALQAKMDECKVLFDEASLLHYSFLKTNNESDAIKAQKLYKECSRQISDKLIHSSVKQDIYSLLIAGGLLINCFCAVFYELIEPLSISKTAQRTEQATITAILVLHCVLPPSLILTSIYLFSICLFVFHYLILILKTVRWKLNCDISTYIIFGGTSLHSLSLLSSSFIEEEHQVWYFLWGTFIIISCYVVIPKAEATIRWLLLFLSFRIVKNINQTGDKWAHLPDLSQWLVLDENYYYLHLLFCFSLLLLWFCCFSLYGKQKKALILSAIIIILIYIFHMWETRSSFLVRLIWFITFINLILGLVQGGQNLEHIIVTWMLSCALLMRPYNVILLPACVYASIVTCRYIKNVNIVTVIHIWMGKVFFFCQGHSNSLASIDIAAGYVGLQTYIPFVVIMQVLSHTYAFPVLTSILLLKNNFRYADTIWLINTICQLLILTITCILILIQRHHLFVWSVFAPKLLIESCHSVVLFVQICLFYTISNMHSIFVSFKK